MYNSLMTSSTSQSIEKKLKETNTRIGQAAQQYGRSSSDIQLLAVSKTQPAESLRIAYSLGQSAFGENYLQEAIDKIEALKDCQITWHFIGGIQSNKTKTIAENFDWVHSVDRLKIARRLSDARPSYLPPLNICLQINVSNEDSKSGINLTELTDLANQASLLPNIKLRGLMTLPAASNDFDEQRANFAAIAKAFQQLKQEGLDVDTLSMGMSNDLEAAIAEGATIVRIGSAIFGPRPQIKKP